MGFREIFLSAALATSSLAPAEQTNNVDGVRQSLKELRSTVAGKALQAVDALAPLLADGQLTEDEKLTIKSTAGRLAALKDPKFESIATAAENVLKSLDTPIEQQAPAGTTEVQKPAAETANTETSPTPSSSWANAPGNAGWSITEKPNTRMEQLVSTFNKNSLNAEKWKMNLDGVLVSPKVGKRLRISLRRNNGSAATEESAERDVDILPWKYNLALTIEGTQLSVWIKDLKTGTYVDKKYLSTGKHEIVVPEGCNIRVGVMLRESTPETTITEFELVPLGMFKETKK